MSEESSEKCFEYGRAVMVGVEVGPARAQRTVECSSELGGDVLMDAFCVPHRAFNDVVRVAPVRLTRVRSPQTIHFEQSQVIARRMRELLHAPAGRCC